MEKYIQKLIENTKKSYSNDYSFMLSHYNQENETVKGYNGRQLLELLQNCDDEGSKEVLIKLDPIRKQISIHNTGSPFSEKGYRSLFIPNLSSKTEQKKYIGNKGLGFRSIINWSNAIEIQSNNISLRYSEDNRKDNFDVLFGVEMQAKIRNEENLKENIIPLPFLTLPKLSTIQQESYITSIIIDYKPAFLSDIKKQIKAITPETILFLKNIETIQFEGVEGVKDIRCKRDRVNSVSQSFGPKTLIQFTNGTNWSIFEKEKVLPLKYSNTDKKSEEFYQIKIAVEEKFEHSSPYLYSFFPTLIQLRQPYILHATFDLDATRNQINDSKKNKFILKKIVKFTTKIAKYFSQKEVSYKPLEILYHAHKADTLEGLGYYDLITDALHTEAILPCVDNTYKTVFNSIFITNGFGQMLLDIGATDEISGHLLPYKNLDLATYDFQNKVSNSLEGIEAIVNTLNAIAEKDLSIEDRASFIYQIVENCDFIKTDFRDGMNFLINEKSENIEAGEYIYTPVTKNNELETPAYANIQFVNRGLFDQLLVEFNYYEDENSNKSRFIFDQLKGFCNIHSYEPATLAQKIISESKNRIKDHPDLSHETVREMNRCLYSNFLQLNDATKLPETARVPCVTKSGKIKLIDELVLSGDYPTGKKTEIIFEDIHSEDDFIGSRTAIGLEDKEEHKVEEYLKWLGIHSFAMYKTITQQDNDLDEYRFYLERKLNQEIDNRVKVKLWTIERFSFILKEITIEKLLLWISFDGQIRIQLDDKQNNDSFEYFYRKDRTIFEKPSFIKFQIESLSPNNFSDYLVAERFSWVNNFSVDFRNKHFDDFSISKREINTLLILLGAKDDFNDLSIDKVAKILNMLPQRFSTGKKTQTIYKKALGHYKENGIRLTEDVMLFANNGEGLKPYKQSEIYFSDKIKLPKQLMHDFPVFNFPARSGGIEAIEFFGVNNLSDIKIELISSKEIPVLNESFNEFLSQLKPIILTHRLNDVEENKQQKIQASICNKMKFVLCSEIQYKIGERSYDVSDHEFIHHKEQTYYLKVSEDDSLESLQSNRTFTNSCADIISLSFDVMGGRNEFRHMFSGNYADILKNIKTDFGEDTFNEARELLGLADYKQAFWRAVFRSKGIAYDVHMDDLSLEKYIKEKLGVALETNFLDYENINSNNAIFKIRQLFDEINLALDAFAKDYAYKLSLEKLHYDTLRNAILSKKPCIKSAIWYQLNSLSIEEQSEYLRRINLFEDYDTFVSNISEKYKFQFEIDSESILQDYVTSLYPNLDLTTNIDINVFSIKENNEEVFNKEELYLINQSERLKSLLHFKNALNTVKDEIYKECKPMVNKDLLAIKNQQKKIPKLVSSEKLVAIKRKPKRRKNVKDVYTPEGFSAKRLKEIGDESEKIVFDYLKENGYSNIDWVSRDNEGLHYDIRYTDEKGIVKYVEVKSFDSGGFFLSKSEYEFGKSEEQNYEIWLVRNKSEIYPIKDFFSNTKYELIASEYKVYLDLK